jgi:hypothetical protein
MEEATDYFGKFQDEADHILGAGVPKDFVGENLIALERRDRWEYWMER